MVKDHKRSGNDCLICCEDISNDRCVFLHKTRRLTHRLCFNCCEGYLGPIFKQILNNLRNKIYNNVTCVICPSSYIGENRNMCNHSIEIKNLKIPQCLSIYLDFFKIMYLFNNHNAFLCMNSYCGEILEQDFYDRRCNIICPSCDYHWCKNCNISPYHVGKTCMEVQLANNTTDEAKYINTKINNGEIKLCPICSVPVEKVKKQDGTSVGCNKIICTVCGGKWCWLCLTKNIDYDHFNINSNSRCGNKLWDGVETK
jgi:hypothetical protein